MDQYPSNSHKSKEDKELLPKKNVQKVISGTAKPKKKSDLQKFTDVFISEDVENVKSYILMDVLIPAVKKAISDIVTNGIDMILYGESGGASKKSTASKVSYKKYYDKPAERGVRHIDSRTRSAYDYDNVVLDSRQEAEEVLTRMDELIDTYGMVSVMDFYDLVGITGNFTDNNYGWTNIRNASVVRTRDGFMIKMPKVLPLD